MGNVLIGYLLTIVQTLPIICGEKHIYLHLPARRNYLSLTTGLGTYLIATVPGCAKRCFEESTCSYYIHTNGSCSLYETTPVTVIGNGHDAMHFAQMAPCPVSKGYTHVAHLGLCYKLNTDYKIWEDSNVQCESEGGRLLVLSDNDKYDYVFQLFSARPGYFCAWVGMRWTGDQFQWLDGGLSPATAWQSGEPDFVYWQLCVAFEKSGLCDYNCEGGQHYFCEIPMST